MFIQILNALAALLTIAEAVYKAAKVLRGRIKRSNTRKRMARREVEPNDEAPGDN